MKLFDKVKNLFTEEYEEEIKPVKKEVRHVDVTPSTRSEREVKEEANIEEETPKYEEEKKEEKFVFFSDDDFKDLERPKREEKVERKEPVFEKPLYRGATVQPVVEDKKPFKPSLIISPVYGVLDKNYTKDEVVSKKVPTRSYSNKQLSVDDIRNKAYGTIEDEIKDSLLGNLDLESEKEPVVNDIDIFEELEKYNELDKLEDSINEPKDNDIDDIFDELDNKKDQILDELDNKKDEILDELITKKDDIIDNDDIDDLDLDDETLELSKQLEGQKRQLDEINDFIDDTDEVQDEELEVSNNDDLNESELFDLIDSMYEKKDDE